MTIAAISPHLHTGSAQAGWRALFQPVAASVRRWQPRERAFKAWRTAPWPALRSVEPVKDCERRKGGFSAAPAGVGARREQPSGPAASPRRQVDLFTGLV